MRRLWFAFQILIPAAICLISTGTVCAQQASAIQLYLPNGAGSPSQSIRLTLTRDDGFADIVFTDSKGRYLLQTPKDGALFYTAVVESDNRTFATTTVRFRIEASTPMETPIFLRPLDVSKATANAVDVTNFEGAVPAKAQAAYKRGMEFVTTGDLEKAIASLQEAITLYPEYVRALNDLGVIYLKQNRLEDAAAQFRKAAGISKRFFHARLNLGLVLNRQEKYREAIDILAPLYEENHGLIEVRLAYARALQGADEFAEAEKLYRSSLLNKTLLPPIIELLEFNLGVVLNRQGRFADAAFHLEEAIKIDPDSANSHLQLGGALMQLQEFERAEKELLRAYELGGANAGGAQLLLGTIYYGQRKLQAAQKAFEQYLKDVPTAQNAAQITKLIAEIKATPKN